MLTRNTLIIGKNGQLGTALQQQYPEARTTGSKDLDISNKAAVEEYDWEGIDVIINAAAYTNVDQAETPEGRVAAWNINAGAVANLVMAASRINAILVHVSTEYVFDGTQEMHTEDESFSPLSVYGASKAAGDIATSVALKHYILRTSWVIGEGKNFIRTMLNLGKNAVSPTVVNDQIGRLTFTDELVRATDHLLTSQAEYGTYNVSNAGKPASWAEIARKTYASAGMNNIVVTDISTEDYYAGKPVVATRPLESTLDLTKLQSTGFASKDWEDDLVNYVRKEF